MATDAGVTGTAGTGVAARAVSIGAGAADGGKVGCAAAKMGLHPVLYQAG
jgi:hypothetical protein